MQCLWFILLFSDDLSFGKIASQSQSFSFWGSYFYPAKNAIDRNTATCARTLAIGYRSRFKTVWWKVDLGRVHNLYNMGILFKSYDGYGMYTYNPNNRKHYRFLCHKFWHALHVYLVELFISYLHPLYKYDSLFFLRKLHVIHSSVETDRTEINLIQFQPYYRSVETFKNPSKTNCTKKSWWYQTLLLI